MIGQAKEINKWTKGWKWKTEKSLADCKLSKSKLKMEIDSSHWATPPLMPMLIMKRVMRAARAPQQRIGGWIVVI